MDINHDGIGDVCDADMDGDGIPDKILTFDTNGNDRQHADPPETTVMVAGKSVYGDNCPTVSNNDQFDSTSNSGTGDACNTKYCHVVDCACSTPASIPRAPWSAPAWRTTVR